MRFFFDNCTWPPLASTLNGFIEHLGHSAVHIKDLPCGRNAADLEWIALFGRDSAEWVIITGDTRVQRNRAERLAFRQAGLKGFVLAPAYHKTPMHQATSFFLWRWPDLQQILNLTAAPFLFELPMSKSSKIKPLPL